MDKFEYKITEELDEEELNKLGDKGWELTGIEQNTYTGRDNDIYTDFFLYFKRVKPIMNEELNMDEIEQPDKTEQKGGVLMINQVIKELSWTGPGESYSEKGKRNPVRDDTQNLLTLATAMERPVKILELGTAFGLSGLCLLRGCPSAELTTIEFGADAAKIAQENFNRAGVKAKVLTGDAGEVIKTLTEHFDVVFIDHEKKSYLPNFLLLMKLGLIGGRTLVLADNVTDRRAECDDFVRHMEVMFPTTKIIDTECGLLVARV